MKKRIIAVVLLCALAVSSAACAKKADEPSATSGGNQPANAETKTEGGTQAQTQAETGGRPSTHVDITYMVTGDVPNNATMTEVLPAINKILDEKLNVTLKVKWIEWTDYLSKYNLELASQDGGIDLIGTATDWLDAWPNAQKSAFLALTEDMLKTYAPKTFAQVPAANWELCKYDGKIYLIPEDNYAQWTNHGFMYRGDWAKEAGLANGVHSWADLGKYFAYIKTNKPDSIPWDAKPDASIVTQMSDGWLTSTTPAIYIEGLRTDLFFGESKDNPYKLSSYFLEGDGLVNFAKNEKAWADAGYWKEDVLNNTSIDTRQEMHEGLSGADQHHSQTFYNGEAVRMANEYQPGSDLQFFWFGEEMGNVVKLNITHGAMAVAAKSKNPERALQVYDLMRNDEAVYRLLNYGIEGRQYVITSPGVYERPEGFVEDKDGVSFNYWWGRNDDLELVGPLTDIPKRDALMAAYDKVAINYPYGQVVFNLDSISAELDNLSNIFNTYMPRIVFGKMDDPAAYVAEFRDQLKKAGYEKCIAEVEKQLAAVYK